MEDEAGVKAPVTRLRRRLSVEQSEDVKSSSAPNTPTKKRGGRRAAKPELDLIDENASENTTSTRSTKKTVVKDIELVEEKPVTPSRRSARIKSNTSIVSDTTQGIDSPRAKRAARRTSQVGSDNEAPLTPARQTRRTRKDSASNAEKVETLPPEKPIAPITEVIVEESEPPLQKSHTNIEQKHSPSGLRKSPRLSLKRNKSSDSVDANDPINNKDGNVNKDANDLNNSNKENETIVETQSTKNIVSNENRSDLSKIDKNRLSASSAELLKQLNNEPDKNKNILNKSSSVVSEIQSFKSKRHRSKSWTTLADPEINDNKSYSDSESAKKKRKSLSNKSNCVDIQNNNKLNISESQKQILKDVSVKLDKSIVDSPSRTEKQIFSPSSQNPANTTTLESLFEKDPTNTIRTMVYIDESDSNSEKQKVRNNAGDEDQCVPVAVSDFVSEDIQPQEKNNGNSFKFSKDNQEDSSCTKIENKNDSCEPMDVDETIPDNFIPSTSDSKALDTSKNKTLENNDQITNDSTSQSNKRRKSSLTLSTSQNLEKTANENKSTLVLSQLKDISNENNESQSPKLSTHKILSKSDDALDVTQDNETEKKNRSLNYLTSTPLQQKSLIKLAMQGNTSGITCNNTSKIEKSTKNVEEHNSSTSKLSNKSEKSAEESISDEESSQEESNFLDDEAEEASDDYESGDSKDEDEERYEKENEIVEKGETLTSEDELSNDSDYEKDSFIVSSDEEDNELLDGSGDDLSTSDNELKMTAKSKQKYNQRKIKEQKKASREMFESRHKLNESNKSNKSESSKIKRGRAVIDSSDSEDEDIQVKVKKNNKMRLDSSHEASINKSMEHKLSSQEDKSTKSVNNESVNNEVEMTICDENTNDDIDPLTVEIKQEIKTPQKGISNTSVKFIDPENLEENGDDNNKSQSNKTLVDDPLNESNASDASSDSSDNVHIQNYDSILNELNKSNKAKKNKDSDISLNLDRKTKPKKSVPIVDQLNLTQIKVNRIKKMRTRNEVGATNKSSEEKSISKKEHSNDDSDNSIDLHLLFSEESNSSDAMQSNDDIEPENNEDDSFIPLKESRGKTNILETSVVDDVIDTESAKKKNKTRKSLNKSRIEDNENDDNTDVKFFIDTTGTHKSTALDNSLNVSTTKRNEKVVEKEDSNSDSDAPDEVSNKSIREREAKLEEQDNKMNTRVSVGNKSITKTPKDKKKKILSESLAKEQFDRKSDSDVPDEVSNKSIGEREPNLEEQDNKMNTSVSAGNKSITKTPKDKKKKRLSESLAKEQFDSNSDAPDEVSNKSIGEREAKLEEQDNKMNTSVSAVNKSIIKTPKDKKNKRLSESLAKEQFAGEETNASENIAEQFIPDDIEEKINKSDIADKSLNKSSAKKSKSQKKRLSESNTTEQGDEVDSAATPTIQNDTSIVEEHEEEIQNNRDAVDKSVNISISKTPKSEKKKKKRLSESQSAVQIENEVTIEIDHNITLNSSKKQNDDATGEVIQDTVVNKSLVKTPNSTKKKTKKMSESSIMENIDQSVTEQNDNLGSTKKNKKKTSMDLTDITSHEDKSESTDAVSSSKKRKRKSSLNKTDLEQEEKDIESGNTSKTLNVSTSTSSQKKKRKISHNVENSEQKTQDQLSSHIEMLTEGKKLSHDTDNTKQRHPLHDQINIPKDTVNTDVTKKKGTKKRKEREDDEENKLAKITKMDSSGKISVPRLPTSVLNKLDDKPRNRNHEVTKPRAISTTNFVVEENKVRKMKPSNYLEESIYIHEDETPEVQKQKRIKNPKVLPFLPTVSTSNSGYTTNFKVNIIPKEVQFVAKLSNVNNFKDDYLQSKKMKRLGTYELYKRNRNIKMSKF